MTCMMSYFTNSRIDKIRHPIKRGICYLLFLNVHAKLYRARYFILFNTDILKQLEINIFAQANNAYKWCKIHNNLRNYDKFFVLFLKALSKCMTYLLADNLCKRLKL